MTLAISGHGTILARQQTPGGAFTDISELGDIPLMEMFRNAFDATVQNRNIDDRVLGVLRRSPTMIPMNFLPADSTHDHLTGLYYALITNQVTGYRFTLPSVAGSLVYIVSGQVSKITPNAPVDGKLSANVTFEFSGLMSIGGVTVGT